MSTRQWFQFYNEEIQQWADFQAECILMPGACACAVCLCVPCWRNRYICTVCVLFPRLWMLLAHASFERKTKPGTLSPFTRCGVDHSPGRLFRAQRKFTHVLHVEQANVWTIIVELSFACSQKILLRRINIYLEVDMNHNLWLLLLSQRDLTIRHVLKQARMVSETAPFFWLQKWFCIGCNLRKAIHFVTSATLWLLAWWNK